MLYLNCAISNLHRYFDPILSNQEAVWGQEIVDKNCSGFIEYILTVKRHRIHTSHVIYVFMYDCGMTMTCMSCDLFSDLYGLKITPLLYF